MKNKRVGTISMAIILIAMGVLMFISQINEVSAIDMAFKLWPLTLVLLGIEILWAKYKSSDEETVIKYDVFSVFIVSDINLTLPSNKKVEIKGGNELDLVMDSLSNNWIVDGVSRVKLRLNKDLDMMVSTILSQEDNLGGNANWTDTQLGTEEDHKHKGELVYGQGSNKLNILDAYEVIADEI